MKTPLIEFRNVCKSFGENTILDMVNLSIYQGEITTIIGKSGVGKSVFLKHIIGLLKPDSGSILFEGRDITEISSKEKRKIKRRFSYMFQNNALFDSLTVFENIALPLRERRSMSEKEIQEMVIKRLEQFELSDIINKFPSQISGGMQKRVALARALITRPEIILFDEPTTGLDPLRKNAVFTMIAHYQRELGFTAVMVSHDIPDVFFISNRVAIISERKIIFEGPPIELEQSSNPDVQEFVNGQDALRDDLTGLMNRKELEQRINTQLQNMSPGEAMVLVWFTIDKLDEIREKVGFVAAQRLTQCLGNLIRDGFGITGGSARFSNRHILTALPGMDGKRAEKIIREMGGELKNKNVIRPSAYRRECVDFTVRAAVVEAAPGLTLDKLISEAKAAEGFVIARLQCMQKEKSEAAGL